jgi:hypothetical protein
MSCSGFQYFSFARFEVLTSQFKKVCSWGVIAPKSSSIALMASWNCWRENVTLSEMWRKISFLIFLPVEFSKWQLQGPLIHNWGAAQSAHYCPKILAFDFPLFLFSFHLSFSSLFLFSRFEKNSGLYFLFRFDLLHHIPGSSHS